MLIWVIVKVDVQSVIKAVTSQKVAGPIVGVFGFRGMTKNRTNAVSAYAPLCPVLVGAPKPFPHSSAR